MNKLNLKKQIIILNLGLSVVPFSFYKLEGPFGTNNKYGKILDDDKPTQLYYPIESLDRNSNLIDATEAGPINRVRYLCLYNRQTGYSIGYIAPAMSTVYSSKNDVVNFF